MRQFYALLIIALPLSAAAEIQEFSFDLADQADRHFQVNLIYGGIEVSGYDGDQILITADLGEALPMPGESTGEGLRRLPNLGQELELHQSGGEVILRAGTEDRPVQLAVQVPLDARLTLTVRQDGAIRVEGVAGEMELQNSSGPIHITGIRSSVVAHAHSDDLYASFASSEPTGPSAFSSWSGNVQIDLPPTITADLRWRTVYGEVLTDLDVTDLSTLVERDVSEDGGSIKGYTTGKVNGGGPEISVTAYSGDITLRKAAP